MSHFLALLLIMRAGRREIDAIDFLGGSAKGKKGKAR